MKATIMILAMAAVLCGCGQSQVTPVAGDQSGQTNGVISPQPVARPVSPVELKRVTSISPTQHQFRMSVSLPSEAPHAFDGAVPAEAMLISAASVNGRFTASILSYDPKERIAVVSTPGRKPETKPYQFDGKVWNPLWSPYSDQRLPSEEPAKKDQ